MEVASQHCDTVPNKTKDILDTVKIKKIFYTLEQLRQLGQLRQLRQLRSIERFRTLKAKCRTDGLDSTDLMVMPYLCDTKSIAPERC